MGRGPKCVCLAREAWRDQEDDGNGSKRHREAGGDSGACGQWHTKGTNYYFF